MANPALLYLGLDGTLQGQDRNGLFTAVGSGALRYVDGFSTGRQAADIWGGTTNLVDNPWFGVDALGWTGAARDTGYALQGLASGLITATGANAEATYSLTVPASTHRLSVWVRNNAAVSRSFQLRYNDLDVGSAVVVAAGAVQRLSASITGTAGTAAAGVRITDSVNGETANIGHMQIEAKAYATRECPDIDATGALRPGNTWDGTAHASSSTRATTTVRTSAIGHLDSTRGSWVARFMVAAHNPQAYRDLILAGSYGTNDWLGMAIRGSDTTLRMRSRIGAETEHSVLAGAVPTGSWVMGYNEWDGSVMAAALNTDALAVSSRDVASGVIVDLLDIGGNGSLEVGNLPIQDILIFDRPLTDAERATLAGSDAWSFGLLGRGHHSRLALGLGTRL